MAPAATVRTVGAVDLAPPPADAAPAPAPAPVRRRRTRPTRILGGVAALLADRLGIDALWVRIAFVLLALVGGVGILVYGALWLAFVVGARHRSPRGHASPAASCSCSACRSC